MKALARILCVVALAAVPSAKVGAQTLPTSDDCRTCHLGLADDSLSAPARTYESDIHAEVGLGCLACHGSGGSDAFDPTAGFLSRPERQKIPELCGRCHSDGAYMRQFNPSLRTDQVSEYWTSVHGQRLREFDDPNVATCIDCHPAHRIRPPDDPASTVYAGNIVNTCGRCHADPGRMSQYGIPTDQVAKYSGSVHGEMLLEQGDLSAPVCNDCHGNHGAAPPGLASVRNVCGQCHTVMAGFFDQSGHEEIFNDNDLPGCVTCHQHHDIQPVSDATLRVRAADVCENCHSPPDTLGLQFDRMADLLDSLEVAKDSSQAVLEEAQNAGMEVSQALFELEDVNNAETRAHSAIHSFRVDSVRQAVRAGLEITGRAEQSGERALDEHRFRRVGLGLSSAIILLLIIGLLLKVRETEDRMEMLISSVENFYERTLSPEYRGGATREQVRLAASALLLEASYADGRFSEEERKHLANLVRSRFGLVSHEAEELIELAERERGQPGQMGRLAAMIAENFSLERKRELLEELWTMVYADGELSAREVEFMEGLARLLKVDPSELAASRRRAETISHEGGRKRT